MRRSFLIWLFALICATFMVTGGVAYYQFRNHAQDRAAQLLSARLTDLLVLVKHASGNLEQVERINSDSAVERTRAIAEMIRLNPEALRDEETLQGFCNDIGAKQICITDARGIVVAAIPSDMVGYDFHSEESGRVFLKCIEVPGSEVFHRSRFADRSRSDYQYACVSRRDSKGLVRVGFRFQQEQIMRDDAGFGQLASNYQLGHNAHIIAFYGGEILNKRELPGVPEADLLALPLNESGEITVNGVDYYIYAVEEDDFRLVGMLPVGELSRQTLGSVIRLIISNFVLFVLMFVLVAYLLQRLVIRGIRVINSTLKRMTDGELSLRVEEKSCPEFSELSTGINSMADTLLDYAEQEHQRLREDLELARNIQFTALPSKFPAYPNHPEFDLYATYTPAKVVGGDFYDFFKLDAHRLAFLVADMSDNGIPAALFMMRCMSAIRSVARTVSDPLGIVTEANRVLCEGNTADLHLTLFLGCLDFRSGELEYVNAGKQQAFIQHVGGKYEDLPMKSGRSLALLPTSVYTLNRLTLEPGERLFLYTEGAVNTMDSGNTPFGKARLLAALQEPAAHVNEVLHNVQASMRGFFGSGDPNLDITMLALEFRGELHAHAEFSTLAGDQKDVASVLAQPLESVLAAPSCISDVQATVNTILNALPEDLMVDIRLRCNESEVQVSLHYAQENFNPLVSLPHLPVDQTHYSSDAGSGSTLTLRKKLE